MMKEAGLILLVFLLMIGMTANDAWAETQVYITFSIGGGLFIGVIGVCINVVFQQRIAQQQKERNHLAAAQLSALKPSEPDSSQRQPAQTDWVSTRLDPRQDAGRAVHPDLEVNFFTFRW